MFKKFFVLSVNPLIYGQLTARYFKFTRNARRCSENCLNISPKEQRQTNVVNGEGKDLFGRKVD